MNVALWLVGGTALTVGVVWIGSRLIASIARSTPDPAWRATGVRHTTARTYDYGKAKAGYLKAQGRTETGRAYKKPQKPHTATVTPIAARRKA